ncbi:MAG: hypothetical protein J7621_26005 [Niastella sp.]|nr:hypothetical protein [Niastella sp.]
MKKNVIPGLLMLLACSVNSSSGQTIKPSQSIKANDKGKSVTNAPVTSGNKPPAMQTTTLAAEKQKFAREAARKKLVLQNRAKIEAEARTINAGSFRGWKIGTAPGLPALHAAKDTLGADYSAAEIFMVNDKNNIPQAISVYGEIYRKWKPFAEALGEPIATVKGRYTHFYNGKTTSSIYLTPQGSAYVLKGVFRNEWQQKGMENSPLGYPVSDEKQLANGVWCQEFERGWLYLSKDNIVLTGFKGNYKIIYRGMKVFGECNSQNEHGGSDEYYVVVGVAGIDAQAQQKNAAYEFPKNSLGKKEYGNMDKGACVADRGIIYEGPVTPLQDICFYTMLVESDQGNSQAYLQYVTEAVQLTSYAIQTASAAYGKPVSVPNEAKSLLSRAITAMASSGDDELGSHTFLFTGEQIMQMAKSSKKNFDCLSYHFETPLFSRYGGSWKLYFEVVLPQ